MIIKRSSAFKSEVKKIKNKSDIEALKTVLSFLIEEELPEKYRPHALVGNYIGYLECHVKPDLLLIYRIDEDVLFLYRIGSHANLFK